MIRPFLFLCLLLAVASGSPVVAAASPANDPALPARVKSLKITILSTMLADGRTLGEWGFAALVEADGHRILFDTGTHPDLVLNNTRTLQINLSTTPEIILSHFHGDHVGGLMTLRRSVLPRSPEALKTVHAGEGIFYPRPEGPLRAETNPMVLAREAFEATGGTFVLHSQPMQLHPGVWLTGPVPRRHPERNWSGSGKVRTPGGVIEDNVPEDASLIIDTEQGLVVLTGCGHAGVINTIEHARHFIRPAPVHALIGGIHLFDANDQTLHWTAEKLSAFKVDYFVGAHCTGIETVYRLRADLGLDRAHAVVGAVGASFELGKGINPGNIAK